MKFIHEYYIVSGSKIIIDQGDHYNSSQIECLMNINKIFYISIQKHFSQFFSWIIFKPSQKETNVGFTCMMRVDAHYRRLRGYIDWDALHSFLPLSFLCRIFSVLRGNMCPAQLFRLQCGISIVWRKEIFFKCTSLF